MAYAAKNHTKMQPIVDRQWPIHGRARMKRTLWITAVVILGFTGSAVAETPTKQDMTTAAAGSGCTLIPFTTTRATCVTANANIHGATSCDVAGACVNATIKAALDRCVTNRTLSNNAYQTTINELTKLKSGAWKGSNQANKDLRKLADGIIGEIKPEQKTHQDQLKTAKDRLRVCPR
jgi:hypothetical protein